jgi:hypothetical protein
MAHPLREMRIFATRQQPLIRRRKVGISPSCASVSREIDFVSIWHSVDSVEKHARERCRRACSTGSRAGTQQRWPRWHAAKVAALARSKLRGGANGAPSRARIPEHTDLPASSSIILVSREPFCEPQLGFPDLRNLPCKASAERPCSQNLFLLGHLLDLRSSAIRHRTRSPENISG